MLCRETSVFFGLFVCFLHTPTMQAHRPHSPASPPRSHHKYCSGTAWRTWKRAQTPRFQCDLPPEQASSSGATPPPQTHNPTGPEGSAAPTQNHSLHPSAGQSCSSEQLWETVSVFLDGLMLWLIGVCVPPPSGLSDCARFLCICT